MTEQELKSDLDVAVQELRLRCNNFYVGGHRICRDYLSSFDNRRCKHAVTGACRAWVLIEKYKKGQEDE